MLEEKDYDHIFSRCDELYVRKDECSENRSVAERRIDNIITDIAVIRTKQNLEIAILAAIATPVIAIAAKLLLGA